jgi:two-component system, OmpR family, sensor histidine kinase MprB
VSFRLRLTVLAVAVAIVGTSVVVYYTDRNELISQVDSDLSASLAQPPLNFLFAGPTVIGGRDVAVVGQMNGTRPYLGRPTRLVPPGSYRIVLPRVATAVQVRVVPIEKTVEQQPPRFSTTTVNGASTRLLTVVLPTETIKVSRSLVEVDRNLSHLRWLLVFISLGGVGAAAILGALVSGRAVAPLRRLTETTERIVETGDLSRRTGRRGRDEISRLSTRLDELLASLELSVRTQRQLVADASHELRTPIATLRANIGLLGSPGALGQAEREELIVDVQDELEAMTTLVGELVELARGEEPELAPREFRLDEVVRDAVERATRRAPELSIQARLEPSTVVGVPERVERAVANLLDNARKWNPPDEAVEVSVHDGLVEVRDHGPGISAEDVPLVFNRFYRSKAARGMPGAGLGLAIVKQIADAHGGSVTVGQGAGGGALLRLTFSSTR